MSVSLLGSFHSSDLWGRPPLDLEMVGTSLVIQRTKVTLWTPFLEENISKFSFLSERAGWFSV